MNVNRIVARILVPVLVLLTVVVFLRLEQLEACSRVTPKETSTTRSFWTAINNNNVLDGNFDKDTFQGHLTERAEAPPSPSTWGRTTRSSASI